MDVAGGRFLLALGGLLVEMASGDSLERVARQADEFEDPPVVRGSSTY